MRHTHVAAIFAAALAATTSMGETRADDGPASPQLEQGLKPDQSYSDVVVVVLDDLPQPARQEVEQIVDDTRAPELKELQNTVGQSQQAVLTLASVGMDPTHVVAAGVSSEGILTLVVQIMA